MTDTLRKRNYSSQKLQQKPAASEAPGLVLGGISTQRDTNKSFDVYCQAQLSLLGNPQGSSYPITGFWVLYIPELHNPDIR